jgi:hypothetical protein
LSPATRTLQYLQRGRARGLNVSPETQRDLEVANRDAAAAHVEAAGHTPARALFHERLARIHGELRHAYQNIARARQQINTAVGAGIASLATLATTAVLSHQAVTSGATDRTTMVAALAGWAVGGVGLVGSFVAGRIGHSRLLSAEPHIDRNEADLGGMRREVEARVKEEVGGDSTSSPRASE